MWLMHGDLVTWNLVSSYFISVDNAFQLSMYELHESSLYFSHERSPSMVQSTLFLGGDLFIFPLL